MEQWLTVQLANAIVSGGMGTFVGQLGRASRLNATAMQSGRSHEWYSLGLVEYAHQWLVITVYNKMSPIPSNDETYLC